MSSPVTAATQPVAAAPQIRQAIANAAHRSGVDFDYLLAQARMESALDPSARARTSSATGLYQFIDRTWLDMLDRHGDPALQGTSSRAQLLALRHDPALSSNMAAALASENRDALRGALGREPDHAELYLAHFLGAGGATTVLTANPATPAASLLPQAAAANRAMFYHSSGAPRSAGELVDTVRTRMDAAKARDVAVRPAPVANTYAPAPRTKPFPPVAAPPAMADTLRSMLADGANSFSPAGQERVSRAYQRLQAMGF